MQTPTPDQIRDGWDRLADAYDDVVTPISMTLTEQILQRVRVGPGVRLLDVAAGSGALAIPAARLGARVLATDISPGLIERLRARVTAEGLDTLRAQVMDGQSLQVPDEAFDVSASQLGVSLFPDLTLGARELVRATKPGGQVLIAAFGFPQRVEFLGFFVGAMRAAVPGFTPPDFSDAPPVRLADPDRLRQLLTTAGLTDVTVETITWSMRFRSGSHLWDLVLGSNPMGAELVAGLTAERCDDVRKVLDGMLRERSGGAAEAVLNTDVNIGIGTR